MSSWFLGRGIIFVFRYCLFDLYFLPDPNDNENRSTAPGKLNSSTQTPTVQPNEEDLSFLLSSVQVKFIGWKARKFPFTRGMLANIRIVYVSGNTGT